MSAVLFATHPDDEVLFAAYTIMREHPVVIIVLGIADVQQSRGLPITPAERSDEAIDAAFELGIGVLHQWQYRESEPDWLGIMRDVRELTKRFDVCYAPMPEDSGHKHHDELAGIAAVAGFKSLRRYSTYDVDGRTHHGVEVEPEPWMIPRKLRALACYESQILHDETGTRQFFYDQLDMREYIAGE